MTDPRAPQPEPDPFTAAVALQVAIDQLTQPGTIELDRDIPVKGTVAYQLAADDRALEQKLYSDLTTAARGEHLELAREVMRDLERLQRRRTARTTGGATLPSLLQQLQDAIPNSSESSGSSSAAGSRSPLAVAALDLVTEIATTTGARTPNPNSLAAQLHAWAARVAGDETQIFTAVACAAGTPATEDAPARPGWADRARAILDPPKKWTAPGKCPDCGRDTIWVEQDGERVRQPVIEFDRVQGTAHCRRCPARWEGESELKALNNVLDAQRQERAQRRADTTRAS